MMVYRRAEVWRHSFLTSALNEKRQSHTPVTLFPGKDPGPFGDEKFLATAAIQTTAFPTRTLVTIQIRLCWRLVRYIAEKTFCLC
jgi:hypothetical protein